MDPIFEAVERADRRRYARYAIEEYGCCPKCTRGATEILKFGGTAWGTCLPCRAKWPCHRNMDDLDDEAAYFHASTLAIEFPEMYQPKTRH